MAKHSSQILEIARKGAEHRYAELKVEIATLVKHFPHLTGKKHGLAEAASTGVKAPRKRRSMSAAARKAVSVRMKKYWAGKRKAN